MLGYFANQFRDIAPFVLTPCVIESDNIALCFVHLSTLERVVSPPPLLEKNLGKDPNGVGIPPSSHSFLHENDESANIHNTKVQDTDSENECL